MKINDQIVIDEAELEESFVRASGPGGQHVNKTSSAVQLRFDLKANTSLPVDARQRLRRLAGSKMTKDGVLLLSSETSRSQARNRERVREQLKDMILKALVKPRRRIKTRPPRAAVKRQKEKKARRSTTKALRQPPSRND